MTLTFELHAEQLRFSSLQLQVSGDEKGSSSWTDTDSRAAANHYFHQLLIGQLMSPIINNDLVHKLKNVHDRLFFFENINNNSAATKS